MNFPHFHGATLNVLHCDVLLHYCEGTLTYKLTGFVRWREEGREKLHEVLSPEPLALTQCQSWFCGHRCMSVLANRFLLLLQGATASSVVSPRIFFAADSLHGPLIFTRNEEPFLLLLSSHLSCDLPQVLLH